MCISTVYAGLYTVKIFALTIVFIVVYSVSVINKPMMSPVPMLILAISIMYTMYINSSLSSLYLVCKRIPYFGRIVY